METPTTDALEILDSEFGDDPSYFAMVAEETVMAQAARNIFAARKAANLTQQALARRVGTTQSVIARLEDNDYEGHSLGMIARIAEALNLRADLRFIPKVAPMESSVADRAVSHQLQSIESKFDPVSQ